MSESGLGEKSAPDPVYSKKVRIRITGLNNLITKDVTRPARFTLICGMRKLQLQTVYFFLNNKVCQF